MLKARLVAQGFGQRVGIDFHETFALVTKFTSICTLIALAARHHLHVEQANVDSAFVQAELGKDKIVFVRPHEGLRHLPEFIGKVLCLFKALYGLKQSGRVWNTKIHATVTCLGYTCTDACVYIKALPDGKFSYIVLYVDDLLFVDPSMPEIQHMRDALHAKFGIKDLGPAKFNLGIQIIRLPGSGFWLGQGTYHRLVIECFAMTGCKTLSTLMEPNLQLRKNTGPVDPICQWQYLQAVGSFMYSMLGTCANIAHAVSYLGHFSANPGVEHWNAVIYLLRYIARTLDYGIFYAPGQAESSAFMACSDSDWAADVNTSRSTIGYAFLIQGGAISWNSHL